MEMPGRKWAASNYRYSYNGQEKEQELFAGANSAEYWMYDSRIGRRWELDPITDESMSSYACFANNSIYYNDLAGLTPTGTPSGGADKSGTPCSTCEGNASQQELLKDNPNYKSDGKGGIVMGGGSATSTSGTSPNTGGNSPGSGGKAPNSGGKAPGGGSTPNSPGGGGGKPGWNPSRNPFRTPNIGPTALVTTAVAALTYVTFTALDKWGEGVDFSSEEYTNSGSQPKYQPPKPPKLYHLYTLRAKKDGLYDKYIWGKKDPVGKVELKAGDIWKIGTTVNMGYRYTQKELFMWGVKPKIEQTNIEKVILGMERKYLFEYVLRKKDLPPGNKMLK